MAFGFKFRSQLKQGWRADVVRDAMDDPFMVYKLYSNGQVIAAVSFTSRVGWVLSGPRLPITQPFQTLRDAQQFAEKHA